MQVSTSSSTLYLSGRLDGRTTGEVRAQLHALMAEHDEVVVDLSDVETVEGPVLRMLAAASALGDGHRPRLVLRGCRPSLRRVITFAGLRRLLPAERPGDTVQGAV